MFELVHAYETAKNEKNKFLRFFYILYAKHKLKSVFFNKFNIYTNSISINKDFIMEFYQVYKCTHEDTNIINTYPYITNVTENSISFSYFQYNLYISIDSDNYFRIIIEDSDIDNKNINIHPKGDWINLTFFKELILMVIYNYCVSYIYGSKSKLYINSNRYINSIKDIDI